ETKPFTLSVEFAFAGVPEARSLSTSAAVTAAWSILSNFRVSLAPKIEHNVDNLQFVEEIDDGMGGKRYVLGDLKQLLVRATTRVEYAFSPALSLEVYAEPFYTAGVYRGFKEPT